MDREDEDDFSSKYHKKRNSKVPRFRCLVCQDSQCFDDIETEVQYCRNAIKCWKITKKDADGQVSYRRGCEDSPERLQICVTSHLTRFAAPTGQYAAECCTGELCNNGSFPTLPNLSKENESTAVHDDHYLTKLAFAILGPILILGVLAIILLYARRKHRKRILAARSMSFDLEEAYSGDPVMRTTATVGDSTLKEYLEQSITSGSGFGLPLLMQRTLAKQIVLKDQIGKGKYGEVWRGLINNTEVAVKIFLSKDEASWTRETEIYSTVLAKHPNILYFIGSDMTSCNSTTQLWLVTDYHALGSLYDYLVRRSLNYNQMYKIMYSVVKGINHLHEELYGDQDKPQIAHRDIKSKNILMKADGECVIADFGLAVTYYEKTNKMTLTPNPRVGTKRYMAPEVLDQVINTKYFESYKRADIYSLGLVFWEICWRTTSNGKVDEYKLPFFDCLDHGDPSFDDMRKIVCVDQNRPVIPNTWASDPILTFITKIIKECWHQKASVRPSSLRIKKNLQKLNL